MKSKKQKYYKGEYNSILIPIIIFMSVFYLLGLFLSRTKHEEIAQFFAVVGIPLYFVIIKYIVDCVREQSGISVDVRLHESLKSFAQDQVIWHTGTAAPLDTILEICNNGDHTLHRIKIVVNPSNHKQDTKYQIRYPLKPGESLLASFPITITSIQRLYIQFFANQIDEALCFDGKHVPLKSAIFSKTKFLFEKIGPIVNYKMSKVKQIDMKRGVYGGIR